MLVAAALLPVAAVGATQRGSVADAATGCGSDDLTVTVRITDAVPGFWWQHALYNVTPSSTTRGGPLLDHLVVPLPTPLGAGVYDVTAVTMDDHSFSLIPDTDVHEQVVVFLDPPLTVGVHTLPTEDLPDRVERIESSIGPLSIDDVVDTVYVLHRSITEPETATDRAFDNSIVPEELTFTCQPVVSPTTLVATTTTPETTTTVPPTTAPHTTPSPAPLPATDGSEVEDQTLRNRTPVAAGVPSASAAAETNLVPAYTG